MRVALNAFIDGRARKISLEQLPHVRTGIETERKLFLWESSRKNTGSRENTATPNAKAKEGTTHSAD